MRVTVFFLKSSKIQIFLLVFCLAFSGCRAAVPYERFSVPVTEQAVCWGMKPNALHALAEKFQWSLSLQKREEYSESYKLTTPLETEFGQADAAYFRFDDDKLSNVIFYYPKQSLERLEEALYQKYGQMESANYAVPEGQEAILGKQYVPEGARVSELPAEDFKKLQALVSAGIQENEGLEKEQADETAKTRLEAASAFSLRAGAYQPEDTEKEGAFLEVRGAYLAVLAGE